MKRNNYIKIIGEVVENPILRNEHRKNRFYTMLVKVERPSGKIDLVPVKLAVEDVDPERNYIGTLVIIIGEVCSYSHYIDDERHISISVVAKELTVLDDQSYCPDENIVHLDGVVYKKPFYRVTSLGTETAKFLLAVNRPNIGVHYIPCIAWWGKARLADKFEVGTHISIEGRFQSRIYRKYISGVESKEFITHEISINKLEVKNDYDIHERV